MEPLTTASYGLGNDDSLVHNWRVWQLARMGVPMTVAEVYADRVDWHQVARLVRRGCPPGLALRIVC